MADQQWRPPAVQQLGTAVLVQGLALHDALSLIRRGIRSARSDGIAPHPRLQNLVDALAAAMNAESMSRNGHHDVALENTLTQLTLERQQIGTRQAATILNLSARQVQRIASSLDGYQTSSRTWIFNRDTVVAYNLEREGQT